MTNPATEEGAASAVFTAEVERGLAAVERRLMSTSPAFDARTASADEVTRRLREIAEANRQRAREDASKRSLARLAREMEGRR